MISQSVEIERESSINTYIDQQEQKELLRFITCGNVDDGKSTLIGRLLHDSKVVYEDQLIAIKNESVRYGTVENGVDLALLVDGLQAEREQGITIDVAYRYFSTDKRKFIIADTPGHEQFTRNMATGASTADLAIILIDARHGVQTQTRRHSYIVNLLGIRHVIVAINKMDLVDYSQSVYSKICEDYKLFFEKICGGNISTIPVSALNGENVVKRSLRMPWYQGGSLLELLENSHVKNHTLNNKTSSVGAGNTPFRFPVQYVNRPNADFRGYCGTIASGSISVGDDVIVLPSKLLSSVKSIVSYDSLQNVAAQGESVTLTLEDQIEVSRGDLIVPVQAESATSDKLRINLIWLNEQTLATGSRFLVKHGARTLTGTLSKIECKVNINTLDREDTDTLELNEVGLCQLSLEEVIAFDSYEQNRITGSLILIDKVSNATVGAGMIIDAVTDVDNCHNKEEVQAAFQQELNGLIEKYFGKPH